MGSRDPALRTDSWRLSRRRSAQTTRDTLFTQNNLALSFYRDDGQWERAIVAV